MLGSEDKKIISVLQKSKVALFPYEIADKTRISEKRVASILFRLTTKIEPERTEQKFGRGFLYYTNLEQLRTRIDKRDDLDGQKQAIYQRIRKTTEIDRQFTRLINLARELGIYSKTVADYLEETACVYTDLKKEEIAGSSYYYTDGILTPEEIEKERSSQEQERARRARTSLRWARLTRTSASLQ